MEEGGDASCLYINASSDVEFYCEKKEDEVKIIRFSDGLANKMFQYSCFLYLKHLGYDSAIDDSTPHYLAHDSVEWQRIFPLACYTKADKIRCFVNGGGFDVTSKFIRRYLCRITKCKKMDNSFCYPSIEDLNRYNYFIGVMQNANMVDSIRNEVVNAFKFAPFELGSINDSMSERLLHENSVAIHVRKGGDYTSREIYDNTCSLDYYVKAISYIKNNVINPNFYVFTDNPQWVEKNFNFFEYRLVSHNPVVGWGNHFDMQLMSCCRHNVTANSTYSWWGAFLNENPQKIVIVPKEWFNKEKFLEDTTSFTLCRNWIAM